MTTWIYENDEERLRMEEAVTAENCGAKLQLIRLKSGISRRDFARIMGCSESTLSRLETGVHKPTVDFMEKLKALQLIGVARFKRMSSVERKELLENVVAATSSAGTILGSIGMVGAGGVAGFSAAGITSGLAAIGGTMLGGVTVIAVLPLTVGAVGYGVVKGIKAICENSRLTCKEVDGRFEIASDHNGIR